MAKTDWNISGPGELSIIEELGSKRLHLLGTKVLLYSGRTNLVDCRVEFEIRFDSAALSTWAGAILRSNAAGDNCYMLFFVTDTPTTRDIRIAAKGERLPGSEVIAEAAGVPFDSAVFSKWRFQAEGNILTVKRWNAGEWEVLLAVEDDEHASGYAGIRNGPVVDRWCRYDNIEIFEKV